MSRSRNRQSRRSKPVRSQNSPDVARLGSLSYRKGHLTEHEIEIFAELRGELTRQEKTRLKQVSQTLRRPYKRLRALDMLRYWGQPLTRSQRRMLPWFAGLSWHRPLPDQALSPTALARHLLCEHPTPTFLFEPFEHPERFYEEHLGWRLCRLLATVAQGRGLAGIRELDSFWNTVPPSVFARFLQTPDDVPVLRGLLVAFVAEWEGPPWLGEDACGWIPIKSMHDMSRLIRMVDEFCDDPLPREQTFTTALQRLEPVPAHRLMYGESQPLGIADGMPPELEGWQSHELRTHTEFHAVGLQYYFQSARLGEISVWLLRKQGGPVLALRINVSMRQVELLGSRRGQDAEAQQVVALWAAAHDLTVR